MRDLGDFVQGPLNRCSRFRSTSSNRTKTALIARPRRGLGGADPRTGKPVGWFVVGMASFVDGVFGERPTGGTASVRVPRFGLGSEVV